MSKGKIIPIILLVFLLLGVVGFVGFKFLQPFLFGNDDNTMEIIELEPKLKMETADYLVLTNALYQKSVETSKNLKETIVLYENDQISKQELRNVIARSNKKITYYYLMALQNRSSEVVSHVEEEVTYDFYLMRRASEETLKYLQDGSSLRLSVGADLLDQAILRQGENEELMAREIARYDINPSTVVVDPSIWSREYTYIEDHPDLVLFKDLNSSERNEYEYYLKHVNEGFMLVSWEMRNMYLAKVDYKRDEISADQLSSSLDGSGYVINRVYEELQMLEAPNGLETLQEDTRKTITLYRDALLEIQKFRMTGKLEHFDNATIIVDQADVEAGRIGEFIYNVRTQYGF